MVRSFNNHMDDIVKHFSEVTGPKLEEKIEEIVDRKVEEVME